MNRRVGAQLTATPGVTRLVVLLTSSVVTIVTALSMLGAMLVDIAAELGVSVGQAGQLGTASAVPWAVAALGAGPVCDRFGRRSMLTISLFGLGAVTALSALASSFEVLLALRVVTGIVGGAGPTSIMAAAGDHVPVERRGTALGWIFSGFGLAAVVGVPIAGAIGGTFGWRASFAVVGLVLILGGVFVWFWLPKDVARPPAGSSLLAAYWNVLRAPRLANLLAANVGERIVFVSVGLYLAAFLMQTYGISTVQAAPALAFAAVGTVAGNVVGGRLADRYNRPLMFAATQLVAALFVALLFLWPLGVIGSTIVATLFGIANAASRPPFMALAAQISEENRGTALGFVSSSSQLGWALGAALGGLAIGWGGYSGLALLGALAAGGSALSITQVLGVAHFRPEAAGTRRQ